MRNFEYTVIVSFEKGGVKQLKVTAVGLCPQLAVSTTRIDFGTLSIGQSITNTIKLQNQTSLPLEVQGPKAPFLRATPSSLKLESGDSQELIINYRPRNAGPISSHSYFEISGGFKIELFLSGSTVFSLN